MAFTYTTLFTQNVVPLLPQSGTFQMTGSNSAERTSWSEDFLIRGYSTLESAKTALLQYLYARSGSTHPTLDGAPLVSFDVTAGEREDFWNATCTYSALDLESKAYIDGIFSSSYTIPYIRKDQMTFGSSGEQKQIYQSYATQWAIRTEDSAQATDFNRCINFNNGSVGGVSVPHQSSTIQIVFLAQKDWLTDTITLGAEDWVTRTTTDITLGGAQTINRFLMLNRLVGTLNYVPWSPLTLAKGGVKFDSWQAQPTYFEKTLGQEKIQDWFYTINMNFTYKVQQVFKDHGGTTHTAEGWDYTWANDYNSCMLYNKQNGSYKQVNCEEVYEYGNWDYLGFHFWNYVPSTNNPNVVLI